jgi:hypothetical protein
VREFTGPAADRLIVVTPTRENAFLVATFPKVTSS